MIDVWEPMDVEDALELFSSQFEQTCVRQYGVSRLAQASNEVQKKINYFLGTYSKGAGGAGSFTLFASTGRGAAIRGTRRRTDVRQGVYGSLWRRRRESSADGKRSSRRRTSRRAARIKLPVFTRRRGKGGM